MVGWVGKAEAEPVALSQRPCSDVSSLYTPDPTSRGRSYWSSPWIFAEALVVWYFKCSLKCQYSASLRSSLCQVAVRRTLAEVIRFGVSWCFLPICLKSAKEAESSRSAPSPCHLTACVVRGNTVHNGRHPDGPCSENYL